MRAAVTLAAASALALIPVAGQAAGAAAGSGPIYSAAFHTCLDVSTTDPGRYFLDTYGHRCDGSAAQSFTFRPLSDSTANIDEIVSDDTGRCLDQYRFGIRQESCAGSVPPDPTNVQWTVHHVGNSGHRYQLLVTTTLGASPRCVQVEATPNGYPGPLFELAACDSSNPDQILR